MTKRAEYELWCGECERPLLAPLTGLDMALRRAADYSDHLLAGAELLRVEGDRTVVVARGDKLVKMVRERDA
jgi:hypothetical protein